MRIVQAHNYHVVRGGSDIMFDRTVQALRDAGHDVLTVVRDSAQLRGLRCLAQAAAAGFYSFGSRAELETVIRRFRPDIVHVHSVYPLLSPSILDACASTGVPVVMRLADYGLICPTSHNYRDGAHCDACSQGREWNCILHNCRGNMLMSGIYALRTAAARMLRVFHERVAAFSVPSAWVRDRYINAGFQAERLHVVPNVVPVPEEPGVPSQGRHAAYVGRVSLEKGVETLLAAARLVPRPLVIAGDESHMPEVRREAPPWVRFLGAIGPDEVSGVLRGARFVVVPSLCQEAFGLSSAEAMATGLPVIASHTGGLPEVVEHERSGLLVPPGNIGELARSMELLWDHPALADTLGRQARIKAKQSYAAERYVQRLEQLYHTAIGKPVG